MRITYASLPAENVMLDLGRTSLFVHPGVSEEDVKTVARAVAQPR